MPYIMDIPVTTENFQNMGCIDPAVEMDMFEDDELIDGMYAPCIGPECSKWNIFEPDSCRHMEGAYISNLKKQALRGIFMSAIIK
jgi:hypothetical protein